MERQNEQAMRARELLGLVALIDLGFALTAHGGELKPLKECVAEYERHKAQMKNAGIKPAIFFHECWWHTAPGVETTITQALSSPVIAQLAPRPYVQSLRLRQSWPFSAASQKQIAAMVWLGRRQVRHDKPRATSLCAVPSASTEKSREWQSGGAQLNPELLRRGFDAMTSMRSARAAL